jgi:hypothetical protein
MSLTVSASAYVVCDLFSQIRPPVSSLYEVSGATDTGVTIRRRVMERADELSLLLESCGDDCSITFSPQPVDLFQLVGVYPGCDLLFILGVVIGVR